MRSINHIELTWRFILIDGLQKNGSNSLERFWGSWYPVTYDGKTLDTVDIWHQGYIIINLPDDLIGKIKTGEAIINPYGNLKTNEPAEGEKYEQIYWIVIDDIA